MKEQFYRDFRNFIEGNKKYNYHQIAFNWERFSQNESSIFKIDVKLENNKEIVLQEDTGLELGGINMTSFSLVYPSTDLNKIKDGHIHLFGPDVPDIFQNKINFGLFLLIGIEKSSDKLLNDLRSLSFISNGIEGFQIRTIPRKFWCRISKCSIEKGFNFVQLGEAIIYLYKLQFDQVINAIEVLIISEELFLIQEFLKITTPIYNEFKQKYKKKIEEWAKRIDCEYDWGCEICPYQEECYPIKKALIKRKELEY